MPAGTWNTPTVQPLGEALIDRYVSLIASSVPGGSAAIVSVPSGVPRVTCRHGSTAEKLTTNCAGTDEVAPMYCISEWGSVPVPAKPTERNGNSGVIFSCTENTLRLKSWTPRIFGQTALPS